MRYSENIFHTVLTTCNNLHLFERKFNFNNPRFVLRKFAQNHKKQCSYQISQVIDISQYLVFYGKSLKSAKNFHQCLWSSFCLILWILKLYTTTYSIYFWLDFGFQTFLISSFFLFLKQETFSQFILSLTVCSYHVSYAF